MELHRSKAGGMQSYSVTIDDTQLTINLLTNIDLAASKDWVANSIQCYRQLSVIMPTTTCTTYPASLTC